MPYRTLAIIGSRKQGLRWYKMLRIASVFVAGATALQAPRLSSAPAWLNAATLEQPPATSKELLPRERYVPFRVWVPFHAIDAMRLLDSVDQS